MIALFTDAEESGLLGGAAFVREHPWARDVAMTMNFEARGTTGRSMMFETGAGNLDVARVLATLNDVTVSSLSVTIYRSLPNDTDLSELSLLAHPRSTSPSWTVWSAITRSAETRSSSTARSFVCLRIRSRSACRSHLWFWRR